MTFVGANVLAVRDFGIYALLFTGVTIVMGVARALTSEVYTVLMTNERAPERRRRQSQALGASAALGGMVAGIGLLVGLGVGSLAVLVFAVACVPVLVQDTVRFLLVSERRVRAAFVNDLVWVVIQFALLTVIVVGQYSSLPLLGASWGAGAAVAGLFGLKQLGVALNLRQAPVWFRDTRKYSGYYVLEFAALAGSGYSIVYVVALIAGLGGAGAYRGAQAVYGPVTSLIGGLRMVALPAVVRSRERGRAEVVRLSMAFGGVVLAASIGITGGIWFLRDWLVPLLLGATAAAAIQLIIPMGIGRALSSASSGPLLGLRALGATSRSLATRAALSLLTLGGAAVGAQLGGAVGAAWGFAAASAVGCVVWTSMLSRQQLSISTIEERG